MKNLKVYDKAKQKKKFSLAKASLIAVPAMVVGLLINGMIENENAYQRRLEQYEARNQSNYSTVVEPEVSEVEVVEVTEPEVETVEPGVEIATPEIVEENIESKDEVAVYDFDSYVDTERTDNALLTGSATLSSRDYQYFISQLTPTDYLYSELYNIEPALERYENTKLPVSNDNTIGADNYISENELYDIVIRNNKEYLKEKDANLSVCFYDEMSKKELKEVIALVCKTVNDHLANNDYIDKGAISSVLSQLKVFTDCNPTNAYVSPDLCLVVNPGMTSIMQMMNENTDAYESTIIHEIMHLMQINPNSTDDCYNVGLTYEFTDMEVNPLYFNWLYEASAEKATMNYKNQDAIIYSKMISYLESMSLSTILNDNVEVNQLENLNFNRNLDLLFEQFDCETKEQKVELVKMMYGIDIMQMSSEDFYEKYTKTYGQEMSEAEVNDLRYTLRASACESLSKEFYSNLAATLNNKKASLNDAFFLINLFERDIYGHIKYDSEEMAKYNKPFVEKYVQIQDQFFQVLANSTNYSPEQLAEMFDHYSPQVSSLNFLSQDKKAYLTEFDQKLSIYDDYDTIRETNNIMQNNNFSI